MEAAKDNPMQMTLPGVPQAKRGREVPARWAWTEAAVWTERMLATLERGIIGGKWYSLMDKVYKTANLQKAAEKVAAGKSRMKSDGRKCRRYAEQSRHRLPVLQKQLQEGSYQPKPAQRMWIPKPGSKEMRPLGIPPVENRVVEMAVRNVLEPIFEHTFAEHSYGFRPGRGAKDALRRVQQLLNQGKVWVVDADLKGYFDSIPQDRLMKAVEERVADGGLLELIQKFLKQGVMETGKGWSPTDTGTPQGGVLSPLLANIYLNPLDHRMAQRGWDMVRYADDFVILCPSQEQAEKALEEVRQWTAEAGLVLHPVKTRLVDASQKGGFDFLGYHFERGHRWPREKSIDKFKDKIRLKTRRTQSGSITDIIQNVNRTTRGWVGYFKHSVANVLKDLDGWIRDRIRSILRKRRKRKGRASETDHRLYPNYRLAQLGLISMALVRAQAANSHRPDH